MAFRNGAFSSLHALPTPILIADPLKPGLCQATPANPQPGVNYQEACFPRNMIPHTDTDNRISAVAKALMKFWPEPQRVNANPLVGFNFIGFQRRTLDDDQRFVRADHNFSEKDKIFGRYAYNTVTYRVIPGNNP